MCVYYFTFIKLTFPFGSNHHMIDTESQTSQVSTFRMYSAFKHTFLYLVMHCFFVIRFHVLKIGCREYQCEGTDTLKDDIHLCLETFTVIRENMSSPKIGVIFLHKRNDNMKLSKCCNLRHFCRNGQLCQHQDNSYSNANACLITELQSKVLITFHSQLYIESYF